MISSNFKLTYDPAGAATVILDYGDRIGDELEFALAKSVETVQLIDAAAPFLRVAQNAVTTFSIVRATDKPTDKEARAAMLDSLIAAQAASKKPLKIEVNGYTDGRYWQFATATVTAHKPKRYLETPAARWQQTTDIVATVLTYSPPP